MWTAQVCWLCLSVGSHLVLFYIPQMNQMNSRNDCHGGNTTNNDTSPTTILRIIIILLRTLVISIIYNINSANCRAVTVPLIPFPVRFGSVLQHKPRFWFGSVLVTYLPFQVISTALHVMQTRYSDENSVCPSVCHTRIPDKTEERSVQICIPYERTFILVFWEEEWLVGVTPSTWNFWSTDPHWNEIADFQPIIARSASAVTPSEKSSINANRKSTMRFQMSLRWSPYVAPKFPKGGLKNAKTADFH